MNIDLSLDYHAHILPGCDHGSDGVMTSLKQVKMSVSAGIKTICATPHFYPHKETVETFLRRRSVSAELLSGSMPDVHPKIELGAEVLICDGMDNMNDLAALCREGTNELLVEMPMYTWQKSIWDTLYRLCNRRDLQVVIAHADRYQIKDIERLAFEGVALQLNVECINRPLQRRRYLTWIDNGYVKYLGSDIHMTGNGYRDWMRCRRIMSKK